MREYAGSSLMSVREEEPLSNSRMVSTALIAAGPPPMIRCRVMGIAFPSEFADDLERSATRIAGQESSPTVYSPGRVLRQPWRPISDRLARGSAQKARRNTL